MAVGKCLILGEELYNKRCYGNLTDGENVLIINPKNIRQFRDTIEDIIKQPDNASRIGHNAYKVSTKIEKFNEYINHTIDLYASLIE